MHAADFPGAVRAKSTDRARFSAVLRAGVRPSTIALAVAFSGVFTIATVYGGALAETGFLAGGLAALIVPGVALFVVMLAAYLLLPAVIRLIGERWRPGRGACSIAPQWGKRSIALHAFAMLAAWSVYLVALFPGSMNWDTFYQIDQCYPDGTVWAVPWARTGSVVDAHYSDHHPILVTLIYGLFALPSDALFGTWNHGVFAFVFVQAALTAFAFTMAIAYFERIGVPSRLGSAVYLLFCLIPVFPVYAATMIKDSLWAPLFVFYFLMLVECARTRGSFLKEKRVNVVLFVAVGLLLALTKKPGMYIVLVTGVLLLFVYRNAWRAFAWQMGTVAVVMMLVMPLIVFPALDVVPGGKQEARGMLFQQTARFVVQYPDEVTAEERAVIDRVIGYDDLAQRYDPTFSDPVKFGYRYDSCTDADLMEYFGVWLAQGLRHPSAYVEATLATAAPYVNLGGVLVFYDNTGDVEHDGSPLVWHPQELDSLRNAVVSAYDWLAGLPVIAVFFRVGTYAYLVPTMAFMVLCMRRSRFLPVFFPLFLCLAVCIVTPMFHPRYALPLIYAAPLLACLCFAPEPEEGVSCES